MSKNFIYTTICSAFCAGFISTGYAEDFMSFDQLPDKGKLTVDGAVRLRYSSESPARPNQNAQNFSLDTLIAGAKYDSEHVFGSLQWRFYGGGYPYVSQNGYTGDYGRVASVNFPQEAFLGYKIDANHSLTAGIIETPFGIGRFWDSTFVEGLGFVIGVQDAFNLGFKLSGKNSGDTYDIAILLGDAGNYVGPFGNDRYSSNISNPGYAIANNGLYNISGSRNTEGTSVVARYTTPLSTGAVKNNLGASIWYGNLQNADTDSTGDRLYTSIFDTISYGNWGSKLALTSIMIRPQNPASTGNNVVSVGGYDGSYNIASRGILSSVDVNYQIPVHFDKITGLQAYANYSRYDKTAGFNATERAIAGFSFSYNKIYTAIEYRLGKNDPYTNPSFNYGQGLGVGGSNTWDSILYMNFGYYF